MASSSTSHSRKRKRDDGARMPHLRETIDRDTGEVYRVETTRQAKRRHARSGGYKPPTVGQINAADIWNKQEEKIRKDREREERSKKNKLKQEKKDARLRECRQEMLEKGEITIEDTWGKVAASQNRLHKFFGPPKATKTTSKVAQKESINSDEDRHTGLDDEREQEHESKQDRLASPGISLEEDVLSFFTNSPLSQDCDDGRSRCGASFRIEEAMTAPDEDTTCAQSRSSAKRKQSIPSQVMMPPPKRPQMSPPQVPANDTTYSSASCRAGEWQPSASSRTPLRELKNSEAMLQLSRQRISPIKRRSPGNDVCLSRQVIEDVLSGLCTQDLQDDFALEDEKESEEQLTLTTRCGLQANTESCLQHDTEDNANSSTHEIVDVRDEETFGHSLDEADEFGDEGIDDESLAALAATQQLKRELCASSKRNQDRASNVECFPTVFPVVQLTKSKERSPEISGHSLADSFAMDGLNDAELVEGLEDYETSLLVDQNDNLESIDQPPHCKKRRTLPWVKNPISYSFHGANDTDDLLSSPPSPS